MTAHTAGRATAPRARWWVFGVLVVACTFAGWGRTIPNHFAGDDAEEILRAAYPHRYPDRLAHPNGNLRPVAATSLRLDERVFDLHSWGFHVVSIGLHAINTLLVAALATALARRWRASRPELVGMSAGAIFVVLGNHTEAVAMIAARADLLATLGCLVAAIAWTVSRGTPDRGARTSLVLASVAAYAFALGAKESAVSLPLALAVGEVASFGYGRRAQQEGDVDHESLGRAALATWPLWSVLVVYLAWRRHRLGVFVGSYDASGAYDWNPVRLPLRLVELTIRTVAPGLPPLGWVAFVLIAGVATWLVMERARASTDVRGFVIGPLALLLGVIVLALPAAGLGVSRRTTEGERLVYLPSTLTAVLLATGLVAVITRRDRIGRLVLAVAVLGSAVMVPVTQLRWVHATNLANSVIADSKAWKTERPVVVVNPPDTLDGVYVTRNALGASPILLHGWAEDTPVSELSRVRVAGGHDRVALRKVGPRSWTLRLLADGSRFEPTGPGTFTYEVPGVRAAVVRADTIRITVAAGTDPRTVWYVDDGELLPLVSAAS